MQTPSAAQRCVCLQQSNWHHTVYTSTFACLNDISHMQMGIASWLVLLFAGNEAFFLLACSSCLLLGGILQHPKSAAEDLLILV